MLNISVYAEQDITVCVICRGARLGTTRHLVCPFCQGTGEYNDQGMAYLKHHVCDCPVNELCEICRKPCHC